MDNMDALKKKKEFCMVIYDLDLQISFNVTVHSLTIDALWVKFEQDWINGEIRYAQDKDFIDNSAMTLTLQTHMFTQTGTLISHVNLLSSSVIVHTKDVNLSNRNTHLYTCIHIEHLCQRCKLIHK